MTIFSMRAEKNNFDNIEKQKIYLEYAKLILLFIGSVIGFVIITYPQLMVDKNKAEQELKREKAKMIIEALSLPDDFAKAEALLLIMDYYPNGKKNEEQKRISILKDVYVLKSKKEYWQRKLSIEKDPTLRSICLNNLDLIDIEIKKILQQEVNPTKIPKN